MAIVVHNDPFNFPNRPVGSVLPKTVASRRFVDFRVQVDQILEVGDWVAVGIVGGPSENEDDVATSVTLAANTQRQFIVGVVASIPTSVNPDTGAALDGCTVSVQISGYCTYAKNDGFVTGGDLLMISGDNEGTASTAIAPAEGAKLPMIIGSAVYDSGWEPWPCIIAANWTS